MICCFAIVVIFGLVSNIVSGITLALIASFGKEAAKWLSKYATIAGVPITINNKIK